MNYRREIDGLRAVAVVPVILFHAGFQWFSGGYVGVDVFFVISGYLITGIILSEREAGTFSLAGFYERRARRILPALFFVVLACLPFAWYSMTPRDLQSFGQSLVATSVFASNILFWLTSGYFDTASELKPLIHTWSLAVEEQFYVVFPLFIIVFWRMGIRWLAGLTFLAGLLSLLIAQYGEFISVRHPLNEGQISVVSFYMTPGRVWELMIGALIAIWCFKNKDGTLFADRPIGQWGSIVGCLLIVYAVFTFNKNTPFPGFFTIVPTVGAGLIILCASSKTLVGKVLAHPSLVAVGLISYSAYLWHQPLFAFARLRSLNTPSGWVFAGLAAASMVLAYLSWRYVERPFREKGRVSKAVVVSSATALTAMIVAVGLAAQVSKGFESRYGADVLAALAPTRSNEPIVCKWVSVDANHPSIRTCDFGDVTSSYGIALYGDSHAHAGLFSALDEAFKQKGIKGLSVLNDSCSSAIPRIHEDVQFRPVLPATADDCLANHAFLVRYLRERVDGIVVAIRWTTKMFRVEHDVEEYQFDNGEGGIEPIYSSGSAVYIDGLFRGDRDAKSYSIKHLVETMLSTTKMVYLNYQVPETGWHIPHYNAIALRNDNKIPSTITTSHSRFKMRNRFVNETLDSIGEHVNLVRIEPEKLLCNTYVANRCVAQLDGNPLYFDEDHLSNAGARLVVDQILKHVRR